MKKIEKLVDTNQELDVQGQGYMCWEDCMQLTNIDTNKGCNVYYSPVTDGTRE